MLLGIRWFAITAAIGTLAFGSARFSGEEGARAHRTRLAASAEHTCALMDDGTARCWGDNAVGDLGDGTGILRSSPVTVANVGPAASIVAGGVHSCALLVSGFVSCWGQNGFGELGNGGFPPVSLTPVTTIGLADVVSIAAGFFHTCAVRSDGTVWCWGDNSAGQIGNDATGNVPVFAPVQVPGITTAVSVAAGMRHTCALLASGGVRCWGAGSFGQMGNNLVPFRSGPVATAPVSPSIAVGAVELAAGDNFTCALLSDATVSCWGQGSKGQLGNGSTGNSAVPVAVAATDTFVAIGAGSNHACGILAGGGVKCWGSNIVAQLGQPAPAFSALPLSVPVVPLIVEIAAGQDHTCAVIVGGEVQCWGGNGFGQHGDGTTRGSGFSAAQGIGGTFLARGVSAGNQFTCAHRGNGSAACWGAGAQGQLGNGANVSSLNPVAVSGLTLVTAISAGSGSHACSVDVNGRAQCWGDNSRGQLGNASLTPSDQPVFVSAGGAQFTAISAGDAHTCALVAGGTVMCWGAGDRGQLGNGAKTDSPLPVLVSGVFNAVAVSAGSGFACALIASGSVRCWGENSSFQLGDGLGEAQSPLPTTVFGAQNVTAISAGLSHACAETSSGSVLCWGSNSRGQIGNNSTVSAVVATPVSGITNVLTVSAGAFFTCATRAGGGAACWGANDNGELSAIDTASHLTPTTVFSGTHGLPGVVQIAAGTGFRRVLFQGGFVIDEEHTCALLAAGTLRCWGENSQGEVGNGTTANQPQPAPVNSFVANVAQAGALRNSRVAQVTALIDCPRDGEARIVLTLEQGLASGTGHAEAQCAGNLLALPMTIPAQGPAGWAPGAATAQVEAIIRNDEDRIIDDTHWTRQVVLSAGN